ncbi:hypothetical protein [Roseomonas sp. BN140053]|uniref:hypothetical protein n=1 Tax=Roseomonas sp. BN140053 TaxID=3391898 RepID=UPI0039ED4BE4
MTSSKHSQGGPADKDLMSDTPRPPSDLERNPGIGSSKGVFGRGTDPEALQADSTDEGDVANETNREGGVDPDHLGRTNR